MVDSRKPLDNRGPVREIPEGLEWEESGQTVRQGAKGGVIRSTKGARWEIVLGRVVEKIQEEI